MQHYTISSMTAMSPSAPPAGIQGSSELFAVSGMDTTITAFTDVTGNPIPNSTWNTLFFISSNSIL